MKISCIISERYNDYNNHNPYAARQIVIYVIAQKENQMIDDLPPETYPVLSKTLKPRFCYFACSWSMVYVFAKKEIKSDSRTFATGKICGIIQNNETRDPL